MHLNQINQVNQIKQIHQIKQIRQIEQIKQIRKSSKGDALADLMPRKLPSTWLNILLIKAADQRRDFSLGLNDLKNNIVLTL